MGKGLIPADPTTWKVRRRAIVPGFHKKWLNRMVTLFADCGDRLNEDIEGVVRRGGAVEMEERFCSVSLDIIGKAVFNYDFGSVGSESPVVKVSGKQSRERRATPKEAGPLTPRRLRASCLLAILLIEQAVYRTLREAEHRSTSFIPYWNLPYAEKWMSGQVSFNKDMGMLDNILAELINKSIETRKEASVEELEVRSGESRCLNDRNSCELRSNAIFCYFPVARTERTTPTPPSSVSSLT